jgi:hypothetical protein
MGGGIMVPDDWNSLPRPRAEEVWLSCAPFLHQCGIIIFGDPGYLQAPPPPKLPPSNAFDPSDEEDFVHRVEQSPRRVDHFVPTVSAARVD